MRNYFNYFTEVEEHFVRKRGKNLLVSPLDWCLIELWRDQGIPLHVVLRGIERSFESAEQKRSRPPSSLFYCHPAVLEAFEQYQRAMLGSSTPEGSGAVPEEEPGHHNRKVEAYLQRLETAIRARHGQILNRAADRVAALRQEAAHLSSGEQERLDRDLAEIGSSVAQILAESMEKSRLQELSDEVEEEMKIYARRLSKKMRARLSENYLQRKILSCFDLPEFSLLGIDSDAS